MTFGFRLVVLLDSKDRILGLYIYVRVVDL
jgi:hypothetical protein